MRGFEEFMDGEADKSFMGRPAGGPKRETNFENFTFLTNDAERLYKARNLLTEKLPFAARYDQSKSLLQSQAREVAGLKEKIFVISDKKGSFYRKSLSEIFDSFFKNPAP